MYGMKLGGGSSTLIKVEHNGETVYEASPSGGVSDLPSADTSVGKKYSLDGLEITDPAQGELYITAGQLRYRR